MGSTIGVHGVLEDSVPLAEDQVAGDQHGVSLVALGHQGEEHFDFLDVVLDISDAVEDQELVVVESAESTWQVEITLAREQVLREAKGRREEDGVARMPSASLAVVG